MRRICLLCLAVVSLSAPSVFAAESLADWARTLSQPDTHRKILDRIFPDQLGPVSPAVQDKQNGTYFFTDNSSWVRLGREVVLGLTETTKTPYLIVTCMLYHARDEEPVSATSYLFRDTSQRPSALTGGYATHERLHLVKLPKLGKSFIVVEDSVASPQGAMRQWSAFLLDV